MQKAIAYYRVSRKRQENSGLGLEAQQYSVEVFAKQNHYKIINEIIETESGWRNGRKGIKTALKECQESNAVLLIAKLDRLSRSVAFISALILSKVSFKAIDHPNADKFTLHILAAVAEKEREDIIFRTTAALAAAKRRGVKLGKYAKVLSRKNKKKAQLFAKKMTPIIQKLRLKGIVTMRAITDELNRKKVPTFRRNNNKWHLTTVFNLLKRIKRKKK